MKNYNNYCIFANISYHIQHILSILNTNFFKCEMKCIVKVKTKIFKCRGLMPSDLCNPYIRSATALCDEHDECTAVKGNHDDTKT